MRIGILSDSHDHLAHLDRAVGLLAERDVSHWIHLGDYVAPFTAPILNKLPGQRTLIFGNNDGEVQGLIAAFGNDIGPGPTTIELGGRRLMLMHEPYALEAAEASNLYDVILYGHTHQFELRRRGRTVILNPGEVCGWMTDTPTCAILDTETLRVELLTVFGDPVELAGAAPEAPA